MRKILMTLLFCLIFGIVSAEAQTDHCFKNDGLKVQQTVSFTVTKNKIEGTFESGGYDQNTSAETFEFTGTKMGNLLTIKFRGKPPYELPPGTKKISWTLGAKTLKIPTYGKNYNTGKYSTYAASYERCKNE
jgi:hypothetical protein